MKTNTFSFYPTAKKTKEFLKWVTDSGGYVVDVWSCYEEEVCIEVLVPEGTDMSKFAEFEEKL